MGVGRLWLRVVIGIGAIGLAWGGVSQGLLSLPGTSSGASSAAQGVSTNALVVRVIDGDTIVVQVEGTSQTVRLMGVDTPETKHPTRPVEYYGPEAATVTQTALAGATVSLTVDRTGDREDAYGRLLRYVTVEGVNFNAALVRDGYARAIRGFRYARRAEFVGLEDVARVQALGLWGQRGPG